MIMPFDLFREKKYRYTFSMRCEEVEGISLNDGAVRIFLNTHGEDEENITPELKELLYLIENTNDRGRVFQSEKVRKISESVRTIQNNEEVGVRYMQAWEERLMYEREAREEGRAEGHAEGQAIGKQETLVDNIRNLMESLHLSLEEAMDALKVPEPDRQKYRTML
ncbi:MAG: hypothetical protein LUD01_10175 [Clostridiales bacterium]|nr:hypothetical protein [Clostridiales bacterium]